VRSRGVSLFLKTIKLKEKEERRKIDE